MYDKKISDELLCILNKLWKKDRHSYRIIFKKIEEILNCDNIDSYKNMRHPLQAYNEVHINTHFVLAFRLEENTVKFFDYQHHDDIQDRLEHRRYDFSEEEDSQN